MGLRPKVSQTLVAESALNDPTGAVLALAFAGVVLSGKASLTTPMTNFLTDLSISTAMGFVFGIVLAGRETRTLPVAVYNMISFDQLSWGPLAAAALIVTLPVLLLTVFAQRQIVAGLTAGAVKGG